MSGSKGDNSNPRKQKGSGYDVEFARCDLTRDDKPAFDDWLKKSAPEVMEALDIAVDDGYRVTFKLDEKNACVMCSWGQVGTKHKNSGIVLISRSDHPEEAFLLCFYKTYVLFSEVSYPTGDDVAGWG